MGHSCFATFVCVFCGVVIQGGKTVSNRKATKDLALREQRERMRRKKVSTEVTELLRNIAAAKIEMEAANQNFSYAVEPLLVDMYIYQAKAAQTKYSYLINRARELGIEQREYIENMIMSNVNVRR